MRLAARPWPGAAVVLKRGMGAVSTVDKNLGRTPERTAELERLAEEHNGFLFGEVVRATRAPRSPRVAATERSPPTCVPFPAAAQGGREPPVGGLGVLIHAIDDVRLHPLRRRLLFPVKRPPVIRACARILRPRTPPPIPPPLPPPFYRPKGSALDVAKEEALRRQAEAEAEE
jgi:hypothetical protein